jgi:hypothetical protein
LVILFFVLLGLGFRIVRYAQNLPLWSDECLLSVNFIDRGYLELVGPLENGQIAPILFLWIQRLMVDLFGFSEGSLRLFALLCGLSSVLVFWRLAGKVLQQDTVAVLLAVGVFAVSVHPIRHSAEAKPYATDLLVALLVLLPAVGWLRQRHRPGWLWALCAFLPVALALSNPAVFVAGGIGLGLFPAIWRTGDEQSKLAFAAFGVMLLVSVWVLHALVGYEQAAMAMDGLRRYWASSFPPWREPWRLPGWLLSAHTGSAFAYPGGGARGGSTASFVACLIGVVALARRGDKLILICLTAPLGLAFVAASLHLYPYGSEARLMQFAAPAICLLCGQGAATVLGRLRWPVVQRRVRIAAFGGLVVCGILPQIVSSQKPYRTLYDHEVREFARKFWAEQSAAAEITCAYLDYDVGRGWRWQGRKAWYLCNQMIYSPGRRRDRAQRKSSIPTDHTLRCVLFDESPESTGVRDWLTRMKVDHALQGTKTYRAPVTLVDGRMSTEEWRVFEFGPRRPQAERTWAGKEPNGRLIR